LEPGRGDRRAGSSPAADPASSGECLIVLFIDQIDPVDDVVRKVDRK
jgi:hypothetical protein